MAIAKIRQNNLGKSRKVNSEIVDYYLLVLSLTFAAMYRTLCEWRLKEQGLSIDERSIPKALRRGTICPEFYTYILRYLRKQVAQARQEDIVDLEYIPVPLDLIHWPNKETKKKYKEMMDDNAE